MTRAYLAPLPQARARRAAVATAIPVLTTERLTLRAPRAEDWPSLEQIWRTDRARFIGGPYNEEDAWLDFCQACAGWVLRGVGFWTVTLTNTADILGISGLGQEVEDPELEFGWLLTKAAEGHGYATEAAQAIRDHAFAQGLAGFVSYVDTGNTRSIALAERLGARIDTPADWPHPDTLVFRHTPPEPRA